MSESGDLYSESRNWDATGFDYPGFGLKCPECGHVGTYVSCSECGTVMER